MRDLFSLDIGVVVDFGGILGQAETDDPENAIETISDVTDGIGDSIDGYTLPFIGVGLVGLSQTAKAVEKTTEEATQKGLLERVALYIGPSLNLKFVYLTTGVCIGGFGCFAIGGGVRFGSFGIGFLIPIWKWW